MKDIFILGSKGIPAKYGGFETFVDKLTEKKKSDDLKYHIACLAHDSDRFEYNNASCRNINVPKIGSSRAILYDIYALKECEKYIKKNNLKNCIVYILACRIGPFIGYYKKRLTKLGAKVYVNPDGHEWKRSKWNLVIKAYWKFSEKLMVKHADLLICDSKEIERYIKEDYMKFQPNTIFISYGADLQEKSTYDDYDNLKKWYSKFSIKEKQYYLIVGRFVPENNYETMIREFMSSKTEKELVIITNVEKNKFYDLLLNKTCFENDRRIKFVGTVYDQRLLKLIREKAYGYIHGHEVGGTNPSLLEALATTPLNLLLDVAFNREVGKDGAVYFNKNIGNLSGLINEMDACEENRDMNIRKMFSINELSIKAKERIKSEYSWEKIVADYEKLFLT